MTNAYRADRPGEREKPDPDFVAPSAVGRDFRIYLTGQAVSLVGDRIATIALVFLVVHLSGSFAPALALFYVCWVVPTLLAGLLTGVLADQLDRRRLMIGCDIGRALLLVVAPALSNLSLLSLYPLVVALSALTLVFNTAARAALPDIVPESRLLKANSLISSLHTGADLAYAVGGFLIFTLKLQTPFYIDAGTFVFSAAMIALMRIPHQERKPVPNLLEFVGRIRAGIEFLFTHSFLKWSTFAYVFAPMAGGAGFVLTPLYASQTLANSPWLRGPLLSGAFRFSVLEVALGVGAFIGAGVIGKLAERWPKGSLFGAGMAASGIADAVLGCTDNLYLACAALALSGLFTSLFFITGMTLLQSLTPSDMRGRVVAGRAMISQTSLAIGSLLAGAAVLVLSIPILWLTEGALLVGASLFVLLRSDVRSQS